MSSIDLKWWERFFSYPNQLIWTDVISENNSHFKHILRWLEQFRNNQNSSIVIPYLNTHGEKTWYCAGNTPRAELHLREALQSFIGPSYSDFDGRPVKIDPDNPIESAFAECTDGWIFRIRARSPECEIKIQHSLDLYLSLLERMPSEKRSHINSLRLLRAELDRAIRVGDESNAREIFQRIKSLGRLDGENLLYIDVEIRAGLGDWESIAKDSNLIRDLTGLRLPKRVLLHVHEALYRIFVEHSEDKNDPTLALNAFRGSNLDTKSTLFGTRRGLKNLKIVKSFFLYEIAQNNPNQSLLDELSYELEAQEDDFSKSLLLLLPKKKESKAQVSELHSADEAFNNFQVDRAFELYFTAPPSVRRLSQLIRCAVEIGTQNAAKRVIDSITENAYVEELVPALATKLQYLEQLSSAQRYDGSYSISGWLDWAILVEKGLNTDEALEIFRNNFESWNIRVLADSKECTESLTEIINNSTGDSELIFREVTPSLFQCINENIQTPSRFVKPLFLLLVTKVTFFSDPSQNELELVREMVESLMTIGLDKNEYVSLVSDLEELLGSQISSYRLSWALDIVELLTQHVCLSDESRLRIALKVIEEAKRISHRLLKTDMLVIKQLCNDLGIEYPEEYFADNTENKVQVTQNLTDKKIGIYTLEEGVAKRASEILKELYPEVSVELNHDHECTKALTNLAKTADYFIFAWKCSKHQAFYCAKKHRGNASPLIQPLGKGASSILRALTDAL